MGKPHEPRDWGIKEGLAPRANIALEQAAQLLDGVEIDPDRCLFVEQGDGVSVASGGAGDIGDLHLSLTH